MEDQVQWLGTSGQAQLMRGHFLAHLQNLWAQLHVVRFVTPCTLPKVASRYTALVPITEGIDGALEVVRRGV
jgi:hypothetical protein